MNKKNYRFIASVIFLLTYALSFAQHTTISKKGEEKAPAPGKHKVMIIPFEPRMYMSEVDYAINMETKMSGKQIKNTFRDGMNEQLYKAFKSQHMVVDMIDDTVKTKKDLENIYQYLNYAYMKVPDQSNYTPPKKEKEEKKIEKGQIVVGTDNEKRFMNAKITNATLVPYLYGKYKSDVFVFVNQLDIKASNSGGPADVAAASGFRKIILHYTVYTYDAKEINSGVAEIEFPANINNPTKIINTYLSKIAQTIAQRVNLALVPKTK